MYQIQFDNLILATGSTPGDCVGQLTNTDNSQQVVIEQSDDSYKAYLRCTILMDKNIFLGEYSADYGHSRTMNDVAPKVCAKMGYRLVKIAR